jgi:hypothetical protein
MTLWHSVILICIARPSEIGKFSHSLPVVADVTQPRLTRILFIDAVGPDDLTLGRRRFLTLQWMDPMIPSHHEERGLPRHPMRSLPEATTAALSQWNACSAQVLQSLRNLPEPSRQEIVLLLNEEDTINRFAAVVPSIATV